MESVADAGVWLTGSGHLSDATTEVIKGGGVRTTLVFPAGGGKTATAASVAAQTAPGGRVLLLASATAHLRDALSTWRQWHDPGPCAAFAVAGDLSTRTGNRARTSTADVTAVNSPAALARWIAEHQGGTLVAACHDAADLLRRAHRFHGLPPWDLIVVEEAQRTAVEPVAADSPYAAIHYDDLVPAFRRLYLTATPQVALTVNPPSPGSRSPLAVAMDENRLFGEKSAHVTRAELVGDGLVSPYRIELMGVPSRDFTPDLAPEGHRRAYRRAAAYSVTGAMKRFGLRRVRSVHQSREDAREFCMQMAVWDPDVHLTAPGEPAIPRGPRLPAVWCHRYRPGDDAVPQDLDALVLADPEMGVLDLVDVLGGFLRQRPERTPMLTILVPVPMSYEQMSQPRARCPAYFPASRVLAALQAHDPGYAEHFVQETSQRSTAPTP